MLQNLFLKLRLTPIQSSRLITSSTNGSVEGINLNKYHQISDETLEDLTDKLESALEDRFDKGADVCLNNGVLTVVVDHKNTYVINKQVPNRQIWLSSPISGPMRFDYISGHWVEKGSHQNLRKLLSDELSKILDTKVSC